MNCRALFCFRSLATVFCFLHFAASQEEVDLPAWRRKREDKASEFASSAVKDLDAGYKRCCMDLGVPEGLATIACRYRDFTSLAGQPLTDAHGQTTDAAKIEADLTKCNVVQHWRYIPKIACCLHDGLNLENCVIQQERFNFEEAEDYKEFCGNAFGQGQCLDPKFLALNARKYVDCFDTMPALVTCARNEMLRTRMIGSTHQKYKNELNAPTFDASQVDHCILANAGSSIVAQRRLYLRVCVQAEKLAYERFLKQLPGEDVEMKRSQYPFVPFYNPKDCG